MSAPAVGHLDRALDPKDRALRKMEADRASARVSGAIVTPTFFINGQRFDGPQDDGAFIDAMEGRLGYRVRSAALDFVARGASSGLLLLAAVLMALLLSNIGLHDAAGRMFAAPRLMWGLPPTVAPSHQSLWRPACSRDGWAAAKPPAIVDHRAEVRETSARCFFWPAMELEQRANQK